MMSHSSAARNASLGETFSSLSEQGLRVPDGFATTAQAYREYLAANDLADRIQRWSVSCTRARASCMMSASASAN